MRIYFPKVLKVVKALTHPIPFIISFLIFPIAPGGWKGFYLNYIFEGLQHLTFYSFTGVAGIVLLLYSLIRYNRKNYFNKEVLKARCKWAWYNSVGLMLIVFSIVSFYHLDSTPTFKESLENDYYFFYYFFFDCMCRGFIAFNMCFVVFSVINNDEMINEFLDIAESYVDLNDPDDFRKI